MSAAAYGLDWLNKLLLSASDASRDGIRLKASGERYAAASMRAALELHEALKDEGKRASFDGAIAQIVANPQVAIPQFVSEVPFMLDAERFSAPNGMFDLPHILVASYFAPRASSGFDVDTHVLLLKWLSIVLIRVQTGFLTREMDGQEKRAAFITRLSTVTSEVMDARLKDRYEKTGRDLLPSPAAVIAVLGSDPMRAIADNSGFYVMVSALHGKLWTQSGNEAIWGPGGFGNDETAMFVQYQWHMRVFLCDAAERLALSLLTCDRVPIVAPWYAMTILAARAYSMAVYSGLKGQVPADPVQYTAFSLVAMAAGDPTGKIWSPARTLFDAGTKSMYLRTEAQDGPYWVLLRATLSGIDTKQATGVAKMLCAINGANPAVCATAVMLCALMRTQTAMVIFSYRESKSSDKDDLASYTLASMAAALVDGVRGQSVFDLVMCTVSGTLDLEFLASDDLALNNAQRAITTWRSGIGAANREQSDTGHASVVEDWCACMTAIGIKWYKVLHQGESLPTVFATRYMRPITRAECRDSLDRVASSHASINHGSWLAMAFKFACIAESNVTGPPLIKSHIDLSAIGSRAIGSDLVADHAWLRLNLRHQAEQVLHSGRRGGMFTAGNHLVLVAWVTVPVSPEMENNGVRIFARALTPHTVSNPYGVLYDDAWHKDGSRRGDDSIVAAAIEFERAMQEHNNNERSTLYVKREEGRAAGVAAAGKETDSKPTEPLLPFLPTTTRAKHLAGGYIEGPSRFNQSIVLPLDEHTDDALQRFRMAAAKPHMADTLFVCQTPYEHGVSVALVSSPAEIEEDLRPAREAKLALEQWKEPEAQRRALIERLRRVQRGEGAVEGKGVLV